MFNLHGALLWSGVRMHSSKTRKIKPTSILVDPTRSSWVFATSTRNYGNTMRSRNVQEREQGKAKPSTTRKMSIGRAKTPTSCWCVTRALLTPRTCSALPANTKRKVSWTRVKSATLGG